MSDTYYITTPIYYPSAELHIGHAYTTVLCDAAARWRRFCGERTLFLTGSDEHGLKVLRSAQGEGKETKTYVDEIVTGFIELWEKLDISYDVFLRTTEKRHEKVVQELFNRLYEKGDIYEGSYDGWYCTPCETFWPETKLTDDKNCLDCDRKLEWVEEKSYFFRISRYADRLLNHIKDNPDFIQPESRKNEMISFIKSGLEDLSVTRTTFDWGIKVPFDPDHVIYVWIDALSNYLTGAGFLQDEEAYHAWWPANHHVVGKDILRFHTIIWPAILLAADIPLPKGVYGHGWLLIDSGKMTKSKGNVVDPRLLIDYIGVDAVRYYLLREMPFGQDTNYRTESLIERTNFDLANDLGNALHRSIAMLEKFCAGTLPDAGEDTSLEIELKKLVEKTRHTVDERIRALHANEALVELWKLVKAINKYIDDGEPWRLAKNNDEARLNTVMTHVFGALRVVALLVSPFLPGTGQKMWEHIGLDGKALDQGFPKTAWEFVAPGTRVKAGEPLFPRLDVEEAVEELEAAAVAIKEMVDERVRETPEQKGEDNLITIDDFSKVEMKLVKVVEATNVAGADRLLKLQVDVGDERRQVVAGLAQHYKPEELIGKRLVLVSNLKPAVLRGERSEGMILAATDDGGRLKVVTVDGDLAPGSRIS